jgi:hypothetical protein
MEPSPSLPSPVQRVYDLVQQRDREQRSAGRCVACGQEFVSLLPRQFCSQACQERAFYHFQAQRQATNQWAA